MHRIAFELSKTLKSKRLQPTNCRRGLLCCPAWSDSRLPSSQPVACERPAPASRARRRPGSGAGRWRRPYSRRLRRRSMAGGGPRRPRPPRPPRRLPGRGRARRCRRYKAAVGRLEEALALPRFLLKNYCRVWRCDTAFFFTRVFQIIPKMRLE